MMKSVKNLDGAAVNVGVFSGEHQWLAGIHEYGCHITPGKAKYLTVPLCPEAAKAKARDFQNTFVYTSKTGKKFIAQKNGKNLKLLYWLAEEVNIPERSFLRTGFDTNVDVVFRKVSRAFPNVLKGTKSEDEYLETVGTLLRDCIKDYAVQLSDPPKKMGFARDPAKTNPLVISGDMINGIEYEVKR